MKRVALLVAVILVLLTFNACVSYENNISRYNEDVKSYLATEFMLELSELGAYSTISYVCRQDHSIFPENDLQLVVGYSDESSFLSEVERLKTAYTYLDEPQMAIFDDRYYAIPLASFSYDGFDFKVAKFDNTLYPKYFGMVGISPEKLEIAYLWVYSPDHDYICEPDADPINAVEDFMEYRFELD